MEFVHDFNTKPLPISWGLVATYLFIIKRDNDIHWVSMSSVPRAVEECLITGYGRESMEEVDGELVNRISSVSGDHQLIGDYIRRGMDLLKHTGHDLINHLGNGDLP